MRILEAGAALAALCWLLPGQAIGQPTGQGCLHEPLAACVAWLGQNMTVTDDSDAKSAIAAAPQTDVNGKPIAGPEIAMVFGNIDGLGLLPSMPGHFVATLGLAPGGLVKSVEVSLPNDPAKARTAADYAHTGLWQALNMMAGAPCVDEAGAYRFFENSIKPAISQPKKDVTLDEIHASTSFFSHSPGVAFCGHMLSYSYLIGTDTEDITIENPHGISTSVNVSMK